MATALGDGTLQFWDVSDPSHPHRKRSLRLDRQVTSLSLTSDRRHVVTGDPPSVWNIGKDGRWETPALVRLETAERMLVPPGGDPSWIGTTIQDDEDVTYLLDFDTDRLYRAMCASFPSSVPEDQWAALFPHLGYRTSCG
jgi:hypothetical protein